MSAFVPTTRIIHPPPDADPAGHSVLKALGRPIGARQSWSVVKAFVVSLLTFGVVPIFAWIRGFRAFAIAEQQQLLHLARWLRTSSAHPLAKRLEEDAEQLRPRWWLWWVALITVIGTATLMWSAIHDSGLHSDYHWGALLTSTYGFRTPLVGWTFADAGRVFTYWIWGMTFVYACHWLVVQLHAQDVKRFVARFSEIAESEGLHRVKARSLGVPLLAPLWILAGVLMLMLHAPWGIVAMLAGAAQRRYITKTGRRTRCELANRVRALLMRRGEQAGSAASIPVPVYIRQRCVEARCRAELPPGVNFCRRCGTGQKARVNRVA